jgi:chaperonin GroES
MKKKAKSKVSKIKSAVKKVSVKKEGKIIPLGDRILLKPLSLEEQTATISGIIIPETVSKEKPEQGMVVAVGEGKLLESGKRMPLSVKVGNKVIFSRYGYDEVKVGGVEYYILREENILAVVNN